MERKQGSRTKSRDEIEKFTIIYEGHLGGCAIEGDGATYYPKMWSHMVNKFNIKSVIDVGCGVGHSADYFLDDLKCEVLGVEGAEGAVEKSLIPREMLVLHDYERNGAFVPEKAYDLAWTCEFVEHVEESAMPNFIETMKKCKYVAMTFAGPGQGGHHHVNEKPAEYWIQHLENAGFKYEPEITNELREIAKQDMEKYSPYYQSHFISRGLFFTNTKL